MKDLEIRGAGNILGAEQSGHVHAVGFDLYTRLLEDAVAELRAEQAGQPVKPRADLAQVSVDLPLEAYIPEDYIEDLPSRLGAYGRLARAADTEEAVVIGEELRDRFGPPPEPVRNLIYAVRVKALARAADVESLAPRGRRHRPAAPPRRRRRGPPPPARARRPRPRRRRPRPRPRPRRLAGSPHLDPGAARRLPGACAGAGGG